MSEVVASRLGVSYADLVAVQPIDLRLRPGVTVAITGPSGAGKSSLLWALAGGLGAGSTIGTVSVAGTAITSREQAAGLGVALIPQGNGLSGSLSAEENILVTLLAHRVRPGEARERAAAALELVGLEESGRHLADELSGGQQQRVALARAFALRPRVLLADESTSDLDAGNRERMIDALRAEAAGGAVVVLATHDPEAAAVADAELALDEGIASWPRPLPVT